MKAPDFSRLDSIATDDVAKRKTTGRYVVVLREGEFEEGISLLRDEGFTVEIPRDTNALTSGDDAVTAIGLESVGVAVVEGSAEQISRLEKMAGEAGPILLIEPEKVRRLLPSSPLATPKGLIELDTFGASFGSFNILEATNYDEAFSTWGLQATRVVDSEYSGAGVRVAILDTGIALETEGNGNVRYHPDFNGRTIVTRSFVEGITSAKDGNGHGTHCAGVACGSRQPSLPPRYGIAYDAEIYVGKIVNDAGEGVDLWAIAGVDWAIRNGCQVVSMSIGGDPKMPGDPFNKAYEEIARRALAAGTVIIAAAGNDSSRPNPPLPIVGPADCPSVIAVTAVDHTLQLWPLCNAGINPNGGEMDFAAPGVRIYSSYVMPEYKVKSGTSMATPYVAGIAALYAEANPGVVGKALWVLMKSLVHPLPLSPQDVGSGFIQAP
jgi:subtilisin